MSEKNVFRVRLMRWGDSSASGRTVTFKLPDDTDEHPFKGLPVGAKNGQFMEMEITILDVEGEPETFAPRKRPPDLKKRIPTLPEMPRTTSETPTVGNVAKGSDVGAPDAPGGSSDQPVAGNRSGSIGEEDALPPKQSAPAVYDGGSGNVDLSSYADHMNQTAETLAVVAEHLGHQIDDRPNYPTPSQAEDIGETPGEKAVGRAIRLCKAVDNQRAGFFYFMRSLYPDVPALPGEGGTWSRDAKVTRDRVCHHCSTKALRTFADDADALKKFEQLENDFERHERFR